MTSLSMRTIWILCAGIACGMSAAPEPARAQDAGTSQTDTSPARPPSPAAQSAAANPRLPAGEYDADYLITMFGKVIGTRRESWHRKNVRIKAGRQPEPVRAGRVIITERYVVGGALTDRHIERVVYETPAGEFIALDETTYEDGQVIRRKARYAPSEKRVYFFEQNGTDKRINKVSLPAGYDLPLVYEPSPMMLRLNGKLHPGAEILVLSVYPQIDGFGLIKLRVVGKRAAASGEDVRYLIAVSDASGKGYAPADTAPSAVRVKCTPNGIVTDYMQGRIRRVLVPPGRSRLPDVPPVFANSLPITARDGARIPTGFDLENAVKSVLVLESDQPLPKLPTSHYQTEARQSPNQSLIVLNAMRPDTLRIKPEPISDAERARYLKPTPDIQSDNTAIHNMAFLVTEKSPGDPPTVADAARLTYYVASSMRGVRDARTGQTALDIFYSKQGDCTEYSMLLTALLRARGIPAKRMAGLVLDDGELVFHAWVEGYVDGRWIGMDPTLNRFGLPATYLFLGELDSDDSHQLGERILRLADTVTATYITGADGRDLASRLSGNSVSPRSR